MPLVQMQVPECDFTGEKFSKTRSGAGVVARGATGRWCVVMFMGPETLQRHLDAGDELMAPGDVERWITENGQPHDHFDF